MYSQEEVLELTGWSRATLLRKRKSGEFPEPDNGSSRQCLWSYRIVDEWLDDPEKNPPSAIDRLIVNRYADELQEWIDERCSDEANEAVDEDYRDLLNDEITELVSDTIDDYREDALEETLAEHPDADEEEIEKIADELASSRAREAAWKVVNEEYGEEIAARKAQLARRFAMAEMGKWLRRGKKDE